MIKFFFFFNQVHTYYIYQNHNHSLSTVKNNIFKDNYHIICHIERIPHSISDKYL